MNQTVTISVAADVMGVHPATMRRWIAQEGAPVVRARKPMLVDIEALRKWRAGSNADVLSKFEAACLDVVRRDAGVDGRTAPAMLGVSDAQAAALVLQVYDRAVLAITGELPCEPYSREIHSLRAIALHAHAMRVQAASLTGGVQREDLTWQQ